jgi:putrescine aminotransferase
MTRNNPQTREWQALSNDHHLAPFSDFKQLKEHYHPRQGRVPLGQ